MKKKFTDLLNHGNFDQAQKLIQSLSKEKLTDFLLNIIFETNSMSIYTFIVFLLLKKETVFFHECAISILRVSMWEGANASALLHARRVSELVPHDITKLAHVLSYFGNPDCNIGKEEAMQLAHKILDVDPQNKTALYTLEFLERS